MIKTNELRVGNLVLYKQDNDELPVLKIDGDSKKVCLDLLLGLNMEVGEQDIDPIPLTPEWLERSGFIKLMHLGRNEYSLWIDEGLTIEALFILNNRTEEIVVSLVTTNENDDENIPLGSFVTYRTINCQYLHQLQNLYFALTGQELQIKLP